MGGENISTNRPEITIEEQLLTADNEGSRTLTLRWRKTGHEPIGLNKMWWAYVQYESGVSCHKDNTANCFTKDTIISKKDGYDYYNVLTFAELNLISRDQLMTIYWTLYAFSNFWIIGTPVQLILTLGVNFFMAFNMLYNYQIILASDQFNDAQTEAFSFWNWVWESVLFWGLGSTIVTWSMTILTLIPIFGPTCGDRKSVV